MYCPECGTQLPEGAMFCPNCGTGTAASAAQDGAGTASPHNNADTAAPHDSTAEHHTSDEPSAAAQTASPTAPVKHRHFPFGTIVAAVILVAAVWMLFTNGGEQPISDLKGITFDTYDDTCSLGTAVSEHTTNAQWESEKVKKGYYNVTLTCVEKMYGLPLEIEFIVTYTDDWVHGSVQAVSFSGDRYSDSTSIMAGMMLLYGQLDENSLSDLIAYDMLWNLLG